MIKWQPINTAPKGDRKTRTEGPFVDVLAKKWNPEDDTFTEKRFTNVRYVYCLDGYGFWESKDVDHRGFQKLDASWRVIAWSPIPEGGER